MTPDPRIAKLEALLQRVRARAAQTPSPTPAAGAEAAPVHHAGNGAATSPAATTVTSMGAMTPAAAAKAIEVLGAADAPTQLSPAGPPAPPSTATAGTNTSATTNLGALRPPPPRPNAPPRPEPPRLQKPPPPLPPPRAPAPPLSATRLAGPGGIAPLAAPMSTKSDKPPPPPEVEVASPPAPPVLPATAAGATVAASTLTAEGATPPAAEPSSPAAMLPFSEDHDERTLEQPIALPIPSLEANTILPTAPSLDMSDVDALLMGDDEEPAPASSRRTVTSLQDDRLQEMPFDDEGERARHTPPPESGRLPAAPQVDLDFDADVTGVRAAPKSTRPKTQDEEAALSPEEISAPLTTRDDVVDWVGEAQRFRPETFGDLLATTLSL